MLSIKVKNRSEVKHVPRSVIATLASGGKKEVDFYVCAIN